MSQIGARGLLLSVLLLAGCTSLEPIAGLALKGDAEPLLGLIRSGRIGVDEPQAWAPSRSLAEKATPLCAAISAGKRQAVSELLAHGANVNLGCTPRHTPLDWTIETYYQPEALDIASLLLEHGGFAVANLGVRTLADVEAAMRKRNQTSGHPVPEKPDPV